MDRGASWAIGHQVTKRQTRLSTGALPWLELTEDEDGTRSTRGWLYGKRVWMAFPEGVSQPQGNLAGRWPKHPDCPSLHPHITCQCFLLVKCHPSDTPRQETLYILIRICAFYTEFMEKAWTSRRDLAWKPCKIFKRKVSTWDNCAE